LHEDINFDNYEGIDREHHFHEFN
jgi:hypothetical protein